MKTTQSAMSEVLTRKGAAKYLTVTPSTLDKLPIRRIQIRRRVVYRMADIEAWLERQAGGG